MAGLARAEFKDIDRAWEAVRHADQSRIHTFIATSDIHLKYKLRMTREQVLEAAVAAVKRARSYTSDVEFSAEDASRTDFDYLCRVLAAVIEAGATTVNIPDTVGYAIPGEWGVLINNICQRVAGIEKAVVSVHCHNDLGCGRQLASRLNTAPGSRGGHNGSGAAGNAAVEEVIMAMHTRKTPGFFTAPARGNFRASRWSAPLPA